MSRIRSKRALRTEVDNFLSYLVESEVASYVQPVVEYGSQVTWPQRGGFSPFLVGGREATHLQYLEWLGNANYSALLFDGSLIQITYDFYNGVMVGHRLAYVPFPFETDLEYLEVADAVDILGLYEDVEASQLRLRTPIRFDFDPERATEDHPAVHLTLGAADCRLPCRGPLRLADFVEFVFHNFYPALWDMHPYFHRLGREEWQEPTLTEAQRARMHLQWAS